jgi:hypothetical protein
MDGQRILPMALANSDHSQALTSLGLILHEMMDYREALKYLPEGGQSLARDALP